MSGIPANELKILIAKSAGRCAFRGCGKILVTPSLEGLKNRENDLYFPVKLLHMKRRVFHWLLAAALAASLPLKAQSVAGRGMGPSLQVFF